MPKPRQRAAVQRVLTRLRRAIVALDMLLESPDPLSAEELALLLATLDRSGRHDAGLCQQLAAVRDRVRYMLSEAFPRGEGQLVVPGAGVLERCRAGVATVWEGRRLAMVIAARCADAATDRVSGELLPVGALCEMVARELVACAGLDTASQTFRKGELRKRGIAPEPFYDTRSGMPSVRFID